MSTTDAESQALLGAHAPPPPANDTAITHLILLNLLYRSLRSVQIVAVGGVTLVALLPGQMWAVSVISLCAFCGGVFFAIPIGNWLDNTDRIAVLRMAVLADMVVNVTYCIVVVLAFVEWPDGIYPAQHTHQASFFVVMCVCTMISGVCEAVQDIVVCKTWVQQLVPHNRLHSVNAALDKNDAAAWIVMPLLSGVVGDALAPEWAAVAFFSTAVLLGIPQLWLAVSVGSVAENVSEGDKLQTKPKKEQRGKVTASEVVHSHVFLHIIALGLGDMAVMLSSRQTRMLLVDDFQFSNTTAGLCVTLNSVVWLGAATAFPFVSNKIGTRFAMSWFTTAEMMMQMTVAVLLFFQRSVTTIYVMTIVLVASRFGRTALTIGVNTILQVEVAKDRIGVFGGVAIAARRGGRFLQQLMGLFIVHVDQFKWMALFGGALTWVAVALIIVPDSFGLYYTHTKPMLTTTPRKGD